MTQNEFVASIARLDWWPGIIDPELQLYSMTKTHEYKEQCIKCIVQETRIWLAEYENWADDMVAPATKNERLFYKHAIELLKELG